MKKCPPIWLKKSFRHIKWNRRKTDLSMAEVIAVCVSERKGEKKSDVRRGLLKEGLGLEGDAHAADWHRQVSLLAEESIQKIRDMGLDVGPGDFAENLTTRGIDLVSLPVGTRLTIGGRTLLEVTQIGKTCHSRCAIFEQVGDCVMPREGIFARVLKGGHVQAGDSIVIVDQQESAH
jgi:MOSC domain-containing protein YiiM